MSNNIFDDANIFNEPKQQDTGSVTISLSKTQGGNESVIIDETKPLDDTPTHPSTTPLSRVHYMSGGTFNLGNYESARMDIGISIPCEVGHEEETFKKCVEFIEKQRIAILKDAGMEDYI